MNKRVIIKDTEIETKIYLEISKLFWKKLNLIKYVVSTKAFENST